MAISPRTVRQVAWIIVLMAVAGCQRSPEAPRARLERMGVPFTAEAFVERAAAGDDEAVKVFLAAGTDPNTADRYGVTPLVAALKAGKSDVAERLVENGARSWEQDDKWSPLMLAAFLGEDEIVDAMLERDANVTAANAQGMTALMFAASRGWSDIVGALARHGADFNARDINGYTALMFAAHNGHHDAAKVLLEAGADRTILSESGQTAAIFAQLNGFGDIAAMLQPSGAASR